MEYKPYQLKQNLQNCEYGIQFFITIKRNKLTIVLDYFHPVLVQFGIQIMLSYYPQRQAWQNNQNEAMKRKGSYLKNHGYLFTKIRRNFVSWAENYYQSCPWLRYSNKKINNCQTRMISPLLSAVPTLEPTLLKLPSADLNPEKFTLPPHDSRGSSIIPINENTTKQQLIQQRGSIFLNNSNPHNPASQQLIKFMTERQLTFTGTDLRYYEISRDQVLVAAASSGLLVPESNEVFQVSQMEKFESSLPMMVKPDWQVNCNNGTVENYVVDNLEALKVMTQTMIEECGGANLQEYIPGREIACLCYSSGQDIHALNPVEFFFKADGPKFITQQLKNDPLRQQWYELCTDGQLAKEVKKNVESFFRILSLSGQFIFTLRINDGKMYLINYKPINFPTQAGVRPFKTSGLLESILFYNSITKKAFLETIVQSAIKRSTQKRKNFGIKINKEKGLPVVYATRTIEPQQVVYEQQNARENIIIVDWIKNHYNRISWGELWSRNSHGWKPISHSCDPNSIVTLNKVQAVRKINEGEEITVDLVTLFYHELTFNCSCGSQKCRKMINFKSQREDWFHEIPSSHFHPWMMDFMFKETLINLINAKNSNVKLEYEPGNCYAVAKRNITQGQRVMELSELPIHNYNTRHSITKNASEFWDTTSSCGQYLNHKCQNYNLSMNEDSTAMVAVTDIPQDRMLSFNYLTTEWNVCFPFTCLCGEEKCYRVIKGFKNHEKAVQDEIYNLGHCSQYVKSLYSAQ